MRWVWLVIAAAGAGCAGAPLPTDPKALEAELLARARSAWDAFPSLRAEGRVESSGEERFKLAWRLEARRGRWARLMLTSALESEPLLDVLALVDRGLAVRVTPPGGRSRLYRGRFEELETLTPEDRTGSAARLLVQLARGELPVARVVSASPSGSVLAVELAFDSATSSVRLRSSDGRLLSYWARGDDVARGCVVAEIDAERSLRLPDSTLTVPADLQAALVSCCMDWTAGSLRIRLTRISKGPLSPLPDWREPARSFDHLKTERWARRASRREAAVRKKLAEFCADGWR